MAGFYEDGRGQPTPLHVGSLDSASVPWHRRTARQRDSFPGFVGAFWWMWGHIAVRIDNRFVHYPERHWHDMWQPAVAIREHNLGYDKGLLVLSQKQRYSFFVGIVVPFPLLVCGSGVVGTN